MDRAVSQNTYRMCPPEVEVFCCHFHKTISEEGTIGRHKVISKACQQSKFGFVLVRVEVGRTVIYNQACKGCSRHRPLVDRAHASSVLAINSAERRGTKHPVISKLQ
jgi:hypothetical protein